MKKRPKINTAAEAESSIYFGSFEVYTGKGRVANPETSQTPTIKTPLKGWPPVLSACVQVSQFVFDDEQIH